MRKLLVLAAAAAVSAACHNRNDDQAGAAPAQGRTDTTAVTHVLDSTAARQRTTDSTAVGQDSSLTSTPPDTLGPLSPGAGAIDTAGVRSDTTAGPSSTAVPIDTAASDTTTASDTTKTNP
jgi:hypothetical protein